MSSPPPIELSHTLSSKDRAFTQRVHIKVGVRIVTGKGENASKVRIGKHHSQIEMGKMIIQKVGIR
jgi:hypothetical protein